MERAIRKLEPISDLSPIFAELAYAEKIAGPVSAIFGEPVEMFEDKLNLKLPGGSPYPWHQDWNCCWRAHTDELITCFIYLDDADEQNGCLQVIPGSHQASHATRLNRAAASRWTQPALTRRKVCQGAAESGRNDLL